MLRAKNIINRVRIALDQIPLSDEDVRSDGAVIGSLSTSFSDEDLLDRVNASQREIVTKVKAQHIPLAIARYDTAEGMLLPSIQAEYVRLLYDRVFYTGSAGDPSNTAPYDPQGFFEGTPSDGEILYQLIAGRRITVEDIFVETDTNPSTIQALSVVVIGSGGTTVVATVVLNTDGNHVTTIPTTTFEINTSEVMRILATSGIDAADFSFSFLATAETFNEDIVEGIRCVQRSVDRNRRMQAAGRSATGRFPVFTFEDEELHVFPDPDNVLAFFVTVPERVDLESLYDNTDIMTVDERFEAAMIYNIVASCYLTMKDENKYRFHKQLFEDEIEVYSIYNRFNSLIDDREVDIE